MLCTSFPPPCKVLASWKSIGKRWNNGLISNGNYIPLNSRGNWYIFSPERMQGKTKNNENKCTTKGQETKATVQHDSHRCWSWSRLESVMNLHFLTLVKCCLGYLHKYLQPLQLTEMTFWETSPWVRLTCHPHIVTLSRSQLAVFSLSSALWFPASQTAPAPGCSHASSLRIPRANTCSLIWSSVIEGLKCTCLSAACYMQEFTVCSHTLWLNLPSFLDSGRQTKGEKMWELNK